MSKIAVVLLLLGTILYQTIINTSQQSEKLYSPDLISAKLKIKENRRAEYISFMPLQEENTRKLLITEGSSSTEGYGVSNEYPRQLAILFGGNYYKHTVSLILDSNNFWTVRNVGNGGDTMIQMIAQYDLQVLPFYNLSLNVNYLTLQGGSNDIANGRTLADLKKDVAAYVAKAKADGFVVGVCTIFHRVGNDVGKVTDYNNWLRTGNSGADFIIDLAAHPFLSDATNTTYFQGDGVHTNNVGQSIIAGVFADSMPTVGATLVSTKVSGRVTDSSGEAIEGATVKMTDSQSRGWTTTTSSLGKYTFDNGQLGETYTLSVSDNRFSFVQPWQLLIINNVASEVNFVALPVIKSRKRVKLF